MTKEGKTKTHHACWFCFVVVCAMICPDTVVVIHDYSYLLMRCDCIRKLRRCHGHDLRPAGKVGGVRTNNGSSRQIETYPYRDKSFYVNFVSIFSTVLPVVHPLECYRGCASMYGDESVSTEECYFSHDNNRNRSKRL